MDLYQRHLINLDNLEKISNKKISKNVLDFFKFRNFRKLLKNFQKDSKLNDYDLKTFSKIINNLNENKTHTDQKIIFIYLPTIKSFSNNSNYNKNDIKNEIKELVVSMNINFIDFQLEIESFDINFEKLYTMGKFGGHLSIYGNLILSKIINNYLITQK